MRGFDLDSTDTKDSISSVSSGSLKDWNIRARDSTVCALHHPQDYYAVWVSYCEIYNEQAFDLLDGCDKKKKRAALRITEDRKGKFFVKGIDTSQTCLNHHLNTKLYSRLKRNLRPFC
jgi:kinesin family protein 20